MAYQPDFNDPRVVKRIRLALGFTCAVIGTKPHSWSTRYLDKHLGRQDTDLGRWLRRHLIIAESDRYNKDTGECKSYIRNELGVRYLRDVLAGNTRQTFKVWNESVADVKRDDLEQLITSTPLLTPSVQQVTPDGSTLAIEWAKEQYKQELESLEFDYEEKNYRLWHPLQNVRKQYKKSIFADAGIKYQYDIECCAPTLIHQYAQKCEMDLYLFALRKYLKDRKSVRQEIAKFAGITEDQAKRVVNAFFAGARLSTSHDCAIYSILDGNISAINKLKDMQYITELREDIKVCWDYVKPYHGYRTVTDRRGITKRIPMNSRQKWNIYFEQERRVLDAIRDYLDKTDNKYFLEHDGWTSNEIDRDALRDYVAETTGYNINLDVVILNTPSHTPSVQQVAYEGSI